MFWLDKLILTKLLSFCSFSGVPIGLFIILGAIAIALPPHSGKKVKK